MTDTDNPNTHRAPLDPEEVGRLREAFASMGEISFPGDACPPAETIWAAARREMAAHEVAPVVDHMGACGVCAEAWRIAISAGPETEEHSPEPMHAGREPAPERAPWLWWLTTAVPVAAAAMLLLLAGLRYVNPLPSATPSMRGGEGSEIESVVPESSLPRDAFRLSWSDGPEGSLYELDVLFVSDDEVRPLATARNLTQSSYLIPAEALADVPAGATLDWQVGVLLPDGRRLTSATFTTTIR